MRPIKLTMKAFGPYSGEETVDFTELSNRNLFLITGPTGAGKTTIFDAISYALYGKASGELRGEDTLRSHFAEKDILTEVELTFELKGMTYHIHRVPSQSRPKSRGEGLTEQKPEATLTIEDGEPRTVIAGVKTVTAKIEEVIGINVEQFKQIMMIPQGEFRKLLTSDSQEREKVLQQLFDTSMYRYIQNDLNEQAKVLGGGIKNQRIERDTLVEGLKVDESMIDFVMADEKNIQHILVVVNDMIEKDQKKLQNLKSEIKKQDEAIEKNLKVQHKVIEDQKNIIQLEEAQKKLLEIEASKEVMLQKEAILVEGEKAEKIVPYEKQIEGEIFELKRKETEKDLLDKEIVDLEEKFEDGKKALEKACSKDVESQLNINREKINTYKSFEEKVMRLSILETQIDNKDKEVNQWVKMITKDEKELFEAKEKNNQQQEVIDGLKDIDLLLERKIGLFDKVRSETKKQEEIKRGLLELLEVEEALKTLKNEEEQCAKSVVIKRQEYKENQLDFYRNQAAILAKELENNKPCPVCGSLEHPNPARLEDCSITEEILAVLEESLQSEEKQLNVIKERYVAKEESLKGKEEHIEHLCHSLDGFQDQESQWSKRWYEVELTEKRLVIIELFIKETIENGQKLNLEVTEFKNRKDKKQAYEKSNKAILETIDRLERQLKKSEEIKTNLRIELTSLKGKEAQIKEDIPEKLRSETALMKAIEISQKNIEDIELEQKRTKEVFDGIHNQMIKGKASRDNLVKVIEESRGKLEGLEEEFNRLIIKEGFADIESYRKARISEEVLREMKQEQEHYKKRLNEAILNLTELKKRTEGVQKVALSIYEEALERLRHERQMKIDAHGQLESKINDNMKCLAKVNQINNQIKDQESKYRIIGKLARIAQGNNPSMMTFERYVLAAFLEDILRAANSRLKQMTQGRYVLGRTSELQRKNKQSGLELEVFDNFTGKSRHVKTLSGGEGFKASLSMALGLSDVVQSYAGGVQLDTMFIDEGFGTLDQESLDSAINCLIDLQKSGRLVGIISHVQELKERMDARLEIVSTNRGSESRFVLS